MKKLLLSVIAMLAAATSFAQNGVVASLSHGSDVTIFYGSSAFKEAVAVAESGDVISLSGGTFLSNVTITKAITLRGTGIDSEQPTYIIENMTIKISEDDPNQFSMEGIRLNATSVLTGKFANPLFRKCVIGTLQTSSPDDIVTNIRVINCKITGEIRMRGTSSFCFVNSYLPEMSYYENASMTATNCIVNSNAGGLTKSVWQNCLFVRTRYTESRLPGDAVATNCYNARYGGGGGYAYGVFVGPSCVNCGEFDYEGTFKDFTGAYADNVTFELTDEAKAKYLGTDGKEAGLYGGVQPYNSTTTYPVITKMEVDEKTDDKGQLGVTIEVE